jgi:hypothetical protein
VTAEAAVRLDGSVPAWEPGTVWLHHNGDTIPLACHPAVRIRADGGAAIDMGRAIEPTIVFETPAQAWAYAGAIVRAARLQEARDECVCHAHLGAYTCTEPAGHAGRHHDRACTWPQAVVA